MCKYNGTWWYVEKGKVNFRAETLCKYNGIWWYVENGKVNFDGITLCNYGGKWWYVERGKVNFGATTLYLYHETWWYIEKGAVNFNYTGYFKYNGIDYSIVKGVVQDGIVKVNQNSWTLVGWVEINGKSVTYNAPKVMYEAYSNGKGIVWFSNESDATCWWGVDGEDIGYACDREGNIIYTF